jgi:hypothetical protein
MIRGWLFSLAVALPWLTWPAAPAPGQTLPSAVDPGIQEQRLLPPRSPRLGAVVLRDIDCVSDPEGTATRFVLQGVILESALRVGGGDPAAHWRPHLGKEVSLEELCAIGRALAGDLARRSGRILRTEIPAQRIAEGMVHIRIVETGALKPGATVPGAD